MNDSLVPQTLAGLRDLLLQRRSALVEQGRSHLDGRSRAQHARDLLLQDGDDAPQRDADREVDFARSDREVVELVEIDQALARIDSGHYGLCPDCGEPIALQRLQSAPQALRCIVCEERHERGQPRPATL